MTRTEFVLALVERERERQEELKECGKFAKTCADDMPDGEKLAVLVEEVGEVAREICERGARAELLEELVQVAAVAVAWAESLGG